MILNLLGEYPYLLWSILLLLLFLVFFRAAGQLKSLIIISGIASALYAFTSPIFVPAYWQPVRMGDWIVGLEDLIFSFANGGIALFLALFPITDKLKTDFTWRSFFFKYLLWTSFGALVSYICKLAGGSVMVCFLCAMAATGGLILLKYKGYRRLSLTGSLGYAAVYLTILFFIGTLFPAFHSQWTLENLWGPMFMGFPVEEAVWALGYGAVFPLVMASSLEVSVAVETGRDEASRQRRSSESETPFAHPSIGRYNVFTAKTVKGRKR